MKKIDDKLHQDLIDLEKRRKRIKEIAIVGGIILAIWYYSCVSFHKSRKMLINLPFYYIGVPNFWKKIGLPYPSKTPIWLDSLIILFWACCLKNLEIIKYGQMENVASFISIIFFFFTISLSYIFFSFFTKAVFNNEKFHMFFPDPEELKNKY